MAQRERIHVSAALTWQLSYYAAWVPATHTSVPVLVVQPLVENALKHRLTPRVRAGTLAVRASVRDGRIRIDVRCEFSASTLVQRFFQADDSNGNRCVQVRIELSAAGPKMGVDRRCLSIDFERRRRIARSVMRVTGDSACSQGQLQGQSLPLNALPAVYLQGR